METFVWLIVPVFMLLTITVYFLRSVFKRTQYFFPKNNSRKNKVIAGVITVLLLAPAVNLYGIWAIVILHVAAFLILSDIIFFLLRKIRKKRENAGWDTFAKRVHYSGVVIILLTAITMAYGYYNMNHVVETDYDVRTSKSIGNEGYKVALITDLHFGISLSEKELKKYADKISESHPDVVVLGGDIVDESTTYEEMKTAIAILADIKSSYGVYYVYGNHDKNNYSQDKNYTKQQLEQELKQSGIAILENDKVAVGEELILVGRSDYSDGDVPRIKLDELLENADQEKVIVIADHQPRDYAEAKAAGADLILSGHTHGGQIWPAGILASTLHLDEKNYGYGKDDTLNEIVTSGIAGWGFPIRTQKHSEYVMINIKGKHLS